MLVGSNNQPESMSVEETLKDTQETMKTPAAAVEEQKVESKNQGPTKTPAGAAVEEQKDADVNLEVAEKKSAAEVEQERWSQKTPPTPIQTPSPSSPPQVIESSQPATVYPDNQLGMYDGSFQCSDEEPETPVVPQPEAAALPKKSLPAPPSSLTGSVAVPPPQAPLLSDSAIDKRVRRCMQPDSKGNYKVCQELREQWAQPGSPRNKVLKLFAQCGHDSDRVDKLY